MSQVTVSGSNTVRTPIFGADLQTMLDAIKTLQANNGGAPANFLTGPHQTTVAGLNAYSINTAHSTAQNFVDAPGVTYEVVLNGRGNDSIDAGSSTKLIVTGLGNDTINIGGGSGTVIAGNGSSNINTHDGAYTVSASSGGDTIGGNNSTLFIDNSGYQDGVNLTGGVNNVTVSGLIQATVSGGTNTLTILDSNTGGPNGNRGTTNINVSGGTLAVNAAAAHLNLVNTSSGVVTLDLTAVTPPGAGNYNLTGSVDLTQTAGGGYGISLNGNDTVHLGAGQDTITETGSGGATVYGGSGLLQYTGGAGNDSITLGSGKASVVAGSGSDTIIAGSGDAKITLGSGSDYVQSGSGNATVYAGTGADTFGFSTAAGGGTTVISGFDASHDQINLGNGGYTSADMTVKLVGAAGNQSTLIHLNDGTNIYLKNFTGPVTGNIVF